MDELYLARISYYYYIKNKTQTEIAKLFKVSRQKINRDLKLAQQLGIVNIDIKFPLDLDYRLEADLESHCSLKKAIVIKSEDEENITRDLSKAASNFLQTLLTDNMTIGVTWGTTLYHFAEALEPKKFNNINIKQLIGGINPNNPKLNGENIARILADKLNGNFTSFYLPAIVSDEKTKELLLKEADTKKVFLGIDECDLVIAGIGSIRKDSTVCKMGYLKESDRAYLENKGIVGDLGLIYYDKDGKPYYGKSAPTTLGYNLFNKPKNMKLMIIAGGLEKKDAINGILNSDIIDYLITDENCAKEIVCT